MPRARGCGSCDRCQEFDRRVAAAEAERQAERQTIHEAKIAELERHAADSKSLKEAERIRKAREKMCASTPPKGHIYGGDLKCVGCGKGMRRGL